MQVTSYRDVIAAFKARWFFLAINLEILCNFYEEKCEINAFENSETFDSWFCDFLFWRLLCLMVQSRVTSDHSVLKTYQLLTELLQYNKTQLQK